jgi:hypothetical protein
MTDPEKQGVQPEGVLDALRTQPGWIDGDVFRIDDNTWAIHGAIPVDGEVILAEFEKPEDAQAILKDLANTNGDDVDRQARRPSR